MDTKIKQVIRYLLTEGVETKENSSCLDKLYAMAVEFKSTEAFIEYLERNIEVVLVEKNSYGSPETGYLRKPAIAIKAVYPKDELRGIGLTKDILLRKLKDTLVSINDTCRAMGTSCVDTIVIISPSEDGIGFYNNLVSTGYLEQVKSSVGKYVYKPTPKLLNYESVYSLEDIWTTANEIFGE